MLCSWYTDPGSVPTVLVGAQAPCLGRSQHFDQTEGSPCCQGAVWSPRQLPVLTAHQEKEATSKRTEPSAVANQPCMHRTSHTRQARMHFRRPKSVRMSCPVSCTGLCMMCRWCELICRLSYAMLCYAVPCHAMTCMHASACCAAAASNRHAV